jgi:farnesyl-diphosphate farnesyltransferase
MDDAISDANYQDRMLPHVSRTFALTIPQLPARLRMAATNAYLLCRIADTVEDEPALSASETLAFLQRFKDAVAGHADPAQLSRDLTQRLSARTLAAERDLVSNMDRVIRVTAGLDQQSRTAIERCVELMCYGMPRFQHNASLRGLPRSTDLDAYCYYVAGVVGEMLTELFCSYSTDIARHHQALHELAASFGQGLQMTNILKDVWEDRSRGACWLPQEVFTRHGFDVEKLSPDHYDARFSAGMEELIGVAHGHLRNALTFTLLIPGRETGIRRFCLWAIGLAVLTLQKIRRHPRYTSGTQVKVSRSAVTMTRVLTDLMVHSDWLLRRLFDLAAHGLPLADSSEVRRARIAPGSADQRFPSPSVPTNGRAPTAPIPAAAEFGFEHEPLRTDRSSAS